MIFKESQAAFPLDSPPLLITPDRNDLIAALENAEIEYKKINDNRIAFFGKAFGCDIRFLFSIHFDSSKVRFIEILRDTKSCNSIEASFKELSEILKKQYGEPHVVTSSSIGGLPCERWTTSDYILDHYTSDRFGITEHLRISFNNK